MHSSKRPVKLKNALWAPDSENNNVLSNAPNTSQGYAVVTVTSTELSQGTTRNFRFSTHFYYSGVGFASTYLLVALVLVRLIYLAELLQLRLRLPIQRAPKKELREQFRAKRS